jgi:hypothetical protein
MVEVEYVELKQGSAVALSYTWGKFNRKDAIIGHHSQGNPISMNLGEEWNI